MNFTKSNINITVNKKTFSIYYSYKKDSTFQDLLEYFAFLCPSLNVCQCFHFKVVNSGDQILNISKAYKISDYSSYLNNLTLYKIEAKCQHSDQNLFVYSKLEVITEFQKYIEKLQKEIGNKNKKITDKDNEIEELKKKNKLLIQVINGDPEKIKILKDLGVKDKNLVPNGRTLAINEKNNEIIIEQNDKKPQFINFYDVIVHIDSIKDINKGWKIEMSQNAKKNYKDFKSKSVLKIGVIGNANKGKPFLLSKISKMNLPSGMSIKTEGLSIKYPDTSIFKDRNIALLDSAGLETPVLISNGELEKEKKNELFREKSREKLITELFLQNYIVNNSDILIVVVDSLSFSEQKLLMKVKREMERSKRTIPLYIIHNLKTFVSKEQVKDYIENTLLKSATFTLEKGNNISTELKENKDEVYNYYEIDQDKDKSQKIFHLIYANESSPAGKIYNPYALNFIERSYQNITGLQPFDVIGSIKERYIKVSKDIIEKTEKDERVTMESFDDTDSNLIKLKNENEIILKKCLIDELGFSNFKANGFEPMYNIFKNKENTKIIVRVEIPGNSSIQSELETVGEYQVIKLTGEKVKDKEPEKIEENIFNMREYGRYSLEIPIKEDKLTDEPPSFKQVEGVCILEYKIAAKKDPFVFMGKSDL